MCSVQGTKSTRRLPSGVKSVRCTSPSFSWRGISRSALPVLMSWTHMTPSRPPAARRPLLAIASRFTLAGENAALLLAWTRNAHSGENLFAIKKEEAFPSSNRIRARVPAWWSAPWLLFLRGNGSCRNYFRPPSRPNRRLRKSFPTRPGAAVSR